MPRHINWAASSTLLSKLLAVPCPPTCTVRGLSILQSSLLSRYTFRGFGLLITRVGRASFRFKWGYGARLFHIDRE